MFEEKLLEPHFTSVLAPYMLDVVEQKRALGNKYNAGVEALSAFDDFCNEQQLRIPAISKELLQKWEKKRPHENETTQCFRISYGVPKEKTYIPVCRFSALLLGMTELQQPKNT